MSTPTEEQTRATEDQAFAIANAAVENLTFFRALRKLDPGIALLSRLTVLMLPLLIYLLYANITINHHNIEKLQEFVFKSDTLPQQNPDTVTRTVRYEWGPLFKLAEEQRNGKSIHLDDLEDAFIQAVTGLMDKDCERSQERKLKLAKDLHDHYLKAKELVEEVQYDGVPPRFKIFTEYQNVTIEPELNK